MIETKGKKLLTIKELSEFLNIPVGSIYNLVYRRRIPFVKVEHLLRFNLEEIEKWLQENEFKPVKD